MNITQFFAAIILSIFLFSCSQTPEPTIYGTWTMIETKCDDGLTIHKKDGEEYERENYTYLHDNMDIEITFNQGNTMETSGIGGGTKVQTTITTVDGIASDPVIETTEIDPTEPGESSAELVEFILEDNKIRFITGDPLANIFGLLELTIEDMTEETLLLSINLANEVAFGENSQENEQTVFFVFEKKE